MATITSAKAGVWSDPTVWTGGVLPVTGDQIEIGHSLTYDLDNETTKYGRININAGGAIIHDNTKKTTIVSTKLIYVNGGKYQAGANSRTLFESTSKTSNVEGTGLAGLQANGGANNTQLILEGSVPMPETTLTAAAPIGSTALTVADASGFSPGEFIAVYYDHASDTSWTWNGKHQDDEGFVVHHVAGNTIHLRQRIAVEDTLSNSLPAAVSSVTVNAIRKWQPGMKVYIDTELFTIASVNEDTGTLTFTAPAVVSHNSGAFIVESGSQKVHAIGDKVYKIATVTTANAAANASSITVANAAKLEVGDRLCIEGLARSSGHASNTAFETTITAKSGSALTVSPVIPFATQEGFIVTKTSRDCVVGTTTAADANRTWIYYTHGSSGITGRKCVLRYAELSHVGNSSSEVYNGLCLRSDFNRTDTEREVRGCVVRDGWTVGRSGIWLYSLQYMHARNNAVIRCHNGINTYDCNGTSIYNTVSMGNGSSSYRNELTYYQNQFQYNIGTNAQYPVLLYSDRNASYPEWHNLFRHHERGLYFSNDCTGQQYSTWMKNRYEDTYYLHHLAEGIRVVVQDIDFRKDTTTTGANWSSGYANYDERGLIGGMTVIVNKNMERGNFEMHGAGGWIARDQNVHLGNGWSYGYKPNHASADIRISQQIYCKYGVPMKVVAYMRKDAAQNGSIRPYIMAKGVYQPAVYSHMQNVNDQWVKVELTFTPARSEMIQIGVGGRGTAGNFWVDPRVSVTTHDLDLIQGPYSVNLMFGLDQIYQDNPGLVLGGVTL